MLMRLARPFPASNRFTKQQGTTRDLFQELHPVTQVKGYTLCVDTIGLVTVAFMARQDAVILMHG